MTKQIEIIEVASESKGHVHPRTLKPSVAMFFKFSTGHSGYLYPDGFFFGLTRAGTAMGPKRGRVTFPILEKLARDHFKVGA